MNTWAYPMILWIGIPVWFFCVGTSLYGLRVKKKMLEEYSQQPTAQRIVFPEERGLQWIRWISTALAGLMILIAAAGPRTYGEYLDRSKGTSIARQPVKELLILLDDSASMSVIDEEGKSGKMTRLELAKQVVDRVLEQLRGTWVSLYLFTKEAEMVVPPTFDYLAVRNVLGGVKVNQVGIPGTNVVDAVHSVFDGVWKEKQEGIDRYLLVLSDGENPDGVDEPKWEKLLDQIAKNEVRVNAVVIGDTVSGGTISGLLVEGKPVQSKAETKLLKDLAEKGTGQIMRVENPRSVQDAVQRIVRDVQGSNDKNTAKAVEAAALGYEEWFQWPLGLAIAALGLAIILPKRWELVDKLVKVTAACLALFGITPAEGIQENNIVALHAEAKAEFESGMDQQAERDYEKLLKMPLERWQRSIITEQLARVKIALGRWQEAELLLSSIPYDEKIAPQVKFEVAKAQVLLQLGKALSEPKSEAANQNIENAREFWNKAQEGYCQLEKIKGAEQCPADISRTGKDQLNRLNTLIEQVKNEVKRTDRKVNQQEDRSELPQSNDELIKVSQELRQAQEEDRQPIKQGEPKKQMNGNERPW